MDDMPPTTTHTTTGANIYEVQHSTHISLVALPSTRPLCMGIPAAANLTVKIFVGAATSDGFVPRPCIGRTVPSGLSMSAVIGPCLVLGALAHNTSRGEQACSQLR